MNKVIITGRLTNDPTVRQTSTGQTVARFTLAVKRAFSKDKVDFVPFVAWRKDADYASQYLHKGDLVETDGELHYETFEDTDGTRTTRAEVEVARVSMLSKKNSNRPEQETEWTKQSEVAEQVDWLSDDSLPF